jgi:hypothetical protein
MAISTTNALAIQAAPGQLLMVAAPTTVTGATLALKIDTLYSLFYTTPSTRTIAGTKVGVAQWALLTADGFKAKLKQEPITFDPNDGAPYTVGYQFLSAEAEVTIADLTADKLMKLTSNSADAQILTAAASGIAGRSTNAHGGESAPVMHSFLYRYPSREFPGQLDHVLIPFGTIELDTDYELSKKSLRIAKVKITACPNVALLANTSTGKPIIWIEDRATVLPTA